MLRSRFSLTALVVASAGLGAVLLLARAARAQALTLYAGGYTRNAGDGLAALGFDPRTGVLSDMRVAAPLFNPDWIEVARDGRTLYAGGTLDGKPGLTALAIGRDGTLREISRQTGEANPVSLAVDATGRWLVGAYYNAGTWAIWPLAGDGTIGARTAWFQHEGRGPDAKRQRGPHAHQALISPDNRRIWITDLGLDRAMISDFDARSGAATPGQPAFVAVAAGSGPRHLAFGRGGRFAYVVSELGNTVTVLQGARGVPGAIQTVSTLPADFKGTSYAAEITLSPDGKYLYASNRGYDSLARYALQNDGTLKLLGWTPVGKEPRHFIFDPTGRWVLVANQKERSISVFAFNAQSGDLTFSSRIEGVPNEPTRLLFGR